MSFGTHAARVCLLLEVLADATYDELEADYMKSYENYYGVSKDSDPEIYQSIVELYLYDMLEYLAGADRKSTDLTKFDYKELVKNCLKQGGMTDEQIDLLIKCLVG